MSAIEQITMQLRQEAAKRGLYLHRYQSNGRHVYGVTIHYVLHHSPNKPKRAKDCSTFLLTLYALEGKTSKCHAYQCLSDLLRTMQ